MYSQQLYNPFMQQMASMGNMQSMNRTPFNYYTPTNTPSNDFQVVNGRESAEMYMMPPNSRIILMDKELPRIYLKETDATGMSNITAYDLVAVEENTNSQSADYITREEFEQWKREILNESITPEISIIEQPIDEQFQPEEGSFF